MEVRELQVKDVFTVARMLGKVVKNPNAQLVLLEAITKGKNANPTEVGLNLIIEGFIEIEADLKVWLASLIGKSVEEFEVMSAKALLDLVEALLNGEDFRDFFERASQLANLYTLKRS